ncbi:uncharacterized protein LOC131167442 [Malania oleifera]|uniref:uncharacterized protein LOC131167442 n=1 Tax=Malania oleifera TaxID=397392 RepID=UPI0025AD9F3D|nr:uncharacterized protein LOC131167442 [Malania oleifera]
MSATITLLSDSLSAQIIVPITDEEINEALFSIGDEKSLGPDGVDFSDTVKEFFESGKLLKQINHTSIALIPKTNHAAVLKFPSVMIWWIMECVTTTAYSISLNSRLHGFFKGKKGLRQGDPLSPLLFVICLEYLSRLLKVVERKPEFHFHPKCESLRITYLAFVDDVMLFSIGDSSLLFVNWLKSNMFHARVKEQDLEDLLQLSKMSNGIFPFRYLVIPLAASRLNCTHYAPLLAIFPIPKNVLEKIVKLCRVFLWGGKRKPMVAWREVCLPKSEVKLGVFDLNAWNLTLLTKLFGMFIQRRIRYG